jgi:hypothetical protein
LFSEIGSKDDLYGNGTARVWEGTSDGRETTMTDYRTESVTTDDSALCIRKGSARLRGGRKSWKKGSCWWDGTSRFFGFGIWWWVVVCVVVVMMMVVEMWIRLSRVFVRETIDCDSFAMRDY